MPSLYIGVDGGASKCIVRVEDESGRLLGRETRGPANIRLSVSQAWESIFSALKGILDPINISLGDKGYRWHVGMGLAGCELQTAYHAFLEQPHPFDSLIVASDAHTACLGAHGGQDGAIIIIGTGVVGFQLVSGQPLSVGGYGFPHDDIGGGASLGLEAVKVSLQSLDGRLSSSSLSAAVLAQFENDKDKLIAWANQANSTAFATLAPIVIQTAQDGDRTAIQLMQQAGLAINHIYDALCQSQTTPLPIALVGGIAPCIVPYLDEKLTQRLVAAKATPDAGAIKLIEQEV